MKLHEVYRKAAWRVEQELNEFSCLAIMHVYPVKILYEKSPEVIQYVNCFDLHSMMPIHRAYSEEGIIERDLRVMLLCMAAAIAETEGELPNATIS